MVIQVKNNKEQITWSFKQNIIKSSSHGHVGKKNNGQLTWSLRKTIIKGKSHGHLGQKQLKSRSNGHLNKT